MQLLMPLFWYRWLTLESKNNARYTSRSVMHLGSRNFYRSPVNEKENLRSDCIFQNKVCCGKVQKGRGSNREKVSFQVCSVAAKTIPTTIMIYEFMSLFSISYEISATLTCFPREPRDKRKGLENRCRKRTCVNKFVIISTNRRHLGMNACINCIFMGNSESNEDEMCLQRQNCMWTDTLIEDEECAWRFEGAHEKRIPKMGLVFL